MTATGARTPILRGGWICPGVHIDLVGAHGPDMREADDALMASARLFVDSRETTIEHIGELTTPISAGIISRESIEADFYELLAAGASARVDRSESDVTVFKNGGGAHLDLMIAAAIIDAMSVRG